MNDFSSDIPERLALDAYSGTSWVPERRAANTIAEYSADLNSIFSACLADAKDEAGRVIVETEFARFHAGYKKRYLSYLASRSRCVSCWITGRSNFPLSRMEKRNGIANRRLDEFLSFRAAGQAAIRKALHPEWRPIMSGDADAIERLTEKLEKAEALQARMVAANAAIRKARKNGPEAVIAAVIETGLGEKLARAIVIPDCMGIVGFAPFQLTNNGAEIRRMKARIEALQRAQSTPGTTVEGRFARIEDSPADNRVRLFFPGKPDAETREKLKHRGFRWSPTVGAWQAYRNSQSFVIAREVAGVA